MTIRDARRNFTEMKKLYSFRETKAFTKNVSSLLSEENYFAFQDYLQENHQLGDVIPGGRRFKENSLAHKRQRKTRRCQDNLLFCFGKRLYLFNGNLRQKQKNRFGKRSAQKIIRTSSGVVKMNDKDFNELLESIRETALMEKGELTPVREFAVKNQKNSRNVKAFAICLTTEDDELIPMKIYNVIFHPHLKNCTVKDENNETLVCPDEWFLPVEFPNNIKKVLEKAELALA